MTNNSMAFVAISSTMVDLNAHREAAIEACLRMRFQPLVLESFAATNQQSLDTALDLINRADIYLGIFGFRYGYIPAGYEKSIIELEYERAGERGIPRLVFFMSDQHPIKVQDVEVGEGAEKLKQLKEQIARTAIVAFFSSPEELRLKIVESLLRYQTERSEPKKALLLIPFAAKYEQLREQLTETLYTLGFAVARFDNIRAGATWANAIADAIGASDLILADVSGANPNIMYELGYAHALKKPTILLADSESVSQLPSDVQSSQILVYDSAEEPGLKTHLSRVLRAYVGSIAS